MLRQWKKWCRLCGRCDHKNEGVIAEVDSIEDSLDIVNKHFSISLSSYNGSLSSMCSDCSTFLTKVEGFDEKCLKADRMFKELMKTKRFTNSSIEAIRLKYEVDEVEEDDPLSMDAENPIAIKEEGNDKHLRESRGQKRKAEKTKLFIVSFQDEKSYVVVSYEGSEPDYSDFMQSVRATFLVPDVSLYSPNDIRIPEVAFKYVLQNDPPAYWILKPGSTSKMNMSSVRSSGPERIDVIDFRDLNKSHQNSTYKKATPSRQNEKMFQREVSSDESSAPDANDDYQSMMPEVPDVAENAPDDLDSNSNKILSEIQDVKGKMDKLLKGFSEIKPSLKMLSNRVSTNPAAAIQGDTAALPVFEQPHFLPIRNEEEFLEFNNETEDSDKFMIAVSYFTWLLRNTLHESVRVMIQKAIDDKLSKSITLFGENNNIKFLDSGLSRAIFQAVINGQDRFNLPSLDEYRLALKAAINCSKQRNREKEKKRSSR